MVGRHCPPNRHGLSTSYRKGEFARGGVRWVDVSETKWWPRGVEGGIGGRLLSLRRAIHGGVKHGETARMIDGILRRCGHGIGTYPHYSHHSHTRSAEGASPLDIDGRATPPGGRDARGSREKF